MNYFDVVLIVPILWGAYKGFTKGLIIEIASLVGLILGLYLGVNFSSITATYISQYIDVNSKMLPIVAFAVTFIGVVILTFIIGKIIEKVVNFVALKLVNKIAGACFGILKYVLIFSALLFVFDSIDKQFHIVPEDIKQESKLYPLIQPIVPTIIPQIKDLDLSEQIPVPEIEV